MMYLSKPFQQDDKGINLLKSEDINVSPFYFNELLPAFSYQRLFYHIDGIDDYIIKSLGESNFFNQIKNKKLLYQFMKKQQYFDNIDFPVGYYLEKEKIKGTIIPYYKDSISINKLLNLYKLDDLKNYYLHTDDEIQNLICLCIDIIDMIEKMFQENIVYTDINPRNFLVYNNLIKIIDFEPKYVFISNKKDKYYNLILSNYNLLIDYILRHYGFNNSYYHPGDNFDDAKAKVKSLYRGLCK